MTALKKNVVKIHFRNGAPGRAYIAIQPTPCAGFQCGAVIPTQDVYTKHYSKQAGMPKSQLAFCARCISFVPGICLGCYTEVPPQGEMFCATCNSRLEKEFFESLANGFGGEIHLLPQVDVVMDDEALAALFDEAEEAAFHELADTFMGRDETLRDEE